jgi:hypothetical protein
MYKILTFKQFNESFQDIFPGSKNKWEKLSYDQALELRYELIEIIDRAYREVFPEGHVRLSDVNDFYKNQDLTFWRAANIDDDPYADVVIFGTKREHGYKISGWGHDGGKGARRHLIEKLASLLCDPKENVYIEVAGRPAEILVSPKYNVPKVPKEKVEAIYPESEFEWRKDGFYRRSYDDNEWTDIEILLGNPTL